MQDKVIVITGASSGIGEKLAEVVIARGARAVLAARREAELGAIAARLGANALAVPTDVTKRADNERLRDRALEAFGQIDVWVANAGRGITRPPSQLTDDDLDEMITVNVKSVLYGLHAVLPHFRERKRGHAIAVSSMLGRIPFFPARSAYSAAKAALNSLMTSFRLELRTELPDVHVSTVLPGIVATPFGQNALHGGPDSRALPGAQSVDEVATIIADLIDNPRAEVYTRPEMGKFAGAYYSADDVSIVERNPPFGGGGPPPAGPR
ncbi:MAG TPA: SDR family NAD(P)-dependent oxidoreductase [Kofleriaceae bacterium]|nr:SDR family NAD(P)-dependent oxidoreductase [Kofleriaceae bacterium]